MELFKAVGVPVYGIGVQSHIKPRDVDITSMKVRFIQCSMKNRKSKEPQCQKTYLWICAPSEDSNQPAHSRSLVRIFTVRILDSQGCSFNKDLIRLRGCSG